MSDLSDELARVLHAALDAIGQADAVVVEVKQLESKVSRLKEQRRADREALGFPGEVGVKPARSEYAPEMGTLETLAYVGTCAGAWEPRVRLLGNAQAGDIAEACRAVGSALTECQALLERHVAVETPNDGAILDGDVSSMLAKLRSLSEFPR